MQHPFPDDMTCAKGVVTDPALFADQPALRAWAWETLKQARGQGVNHAGLHAAGLAILPNPDHDPNAALRSRIHAHAAATGAPTRPAPLIAGGNTAGRCMTAAQPDTGAQFWMVCRKPTFPGSKTEPRHRYATLADATRAAEKLAAQNDADFVVLEVKAIIHPTDQSFGSLI